MNTAEAHDEIRHEDEGHETAPQSADEPHPVTDNVEVRRSSGVAAFVGAAASAVSIAYLSRAARTGAALDWALVVVMGLVAVTYLRAFVDARTPLLVADGLGVRIRLGRTWRGVPWGALAEARVEPRRGLLRDGRLVLEPRNLERLLAEIDKGGRRQVSLSRTLYGAPLAVPLGLSTRVVGADGDLAEALRGLAAGRTEIVEPLVLETDEQDGDTYPEDLPEADDATHEPDEADPSDGPRRLWRDPRPRLAAGIDSIAARLSRGGAGDDAQSEPSHGWDDIEVTQPLVASATPSPLREVGAARRTEVTSEVGRDLVRGATALNLARGEEAARRDLPEAGELRRGADPDLEETVVWGQGVTPIAKPGEPVEPLVLEDVGAEPVPDPVIGPELLAARTRLGLSVDQLADRTRIRPHVIESIEVDDFVPCGGDFYARGHLRTLARVLGVDVSPLLATYDERYADAPISPRRVFEAELATGRGGSIRSTRGGTNWSLLIGVVMALVLAWSIARLVMDDPAEFEQPAPALNGSVSQQRQPAAVIATPIPVTVSASGPVHVVVRDGNGEIVFTDDLTKGQSNKVRAQPPISVKASDGGALKVTVDGKERGRLGPAGRPAQGRFTAK
ncbi:helix-turn-helix domain-containing protein [Nocardioides sp.]|uniref:helix-turn-helix domain-containing protein n=1 Tax=Nocardioides sp. TaxID=35761 RepID=UPI003D10AD88